MAAAIDLSNLSCTQLKELLAKVSAEMKIAEDSLAKDFATPMNAMGKETLAKMQVISGKALGWDNPTTSFAMPEVSPDKMPASVVRGLTSDKVPFIAVRIKPEGGNDSTRSVVVFFKKFQDMGLWSTRGQYGKLLYSGGGVSPIEFGRIAKAITSGTPVTDFKDSRNWVLC